MTAPTPSPSIARVPVPVDTRAPGGTTNAYVAGRLLVDPAARTDALDAAIGLGGEGGGAGGDDATVDAIAVTHTHSDHVGAVAEYADLADVPALAHVAHVDRFAEAAGVEPDGTFAGGETVGDTGVRAVDTPGHAPDHVAFAVAEGRLDADGNSSSALLCGDLAVAEGSVVVGAHEGDLGDYLDSLERVRDAGYERLYPGHGPVIDDPQTVCDRLIEHRLDRERAVLEAVKGGASDLGEVVAGAYEKDLSGVEDLARATVAAHLAKLRDEGRIDDSWNGLSP